MLHFHGSYLGLIMKTGLITGIISLTVSFTPIMSTQFGYSVESENRVVIDHYKTLLIKSSASQLVRLCSKIE